MQRTFLFVPIDGWSIHSRSKGSIIIMVWDLEIWEAEGIAQGYSAYQKRTPSIILVCFLAPRTTLCLRTYNLAWSFFSLFFYSNFGILLSSWNHIILAMITKESKLVQLNSNTAITTAGTLKKILRDWNYLQVENVSRFYYTYIYLLSAWCVPATEYLNI